MSRLSRVVVVLLWSLAGAVSLQAQRISALGDLHLDVIQAELPQNSVHCVLQSRDGYLWIATYEGVVRSDGINYRVFDRQSTRGGLASNGVLEIFEDRSGALWFGTVLGGVTRYADGSYERWGEEEGLDGQFATSVREAGDGAIWIGTSRGLFRINGRRVERAEDPALAGLVRRMIATPDGDLLAGYDDGRLMRVTPAGAATELTSALSGDPVYAIAAPPDGTLWVGTDGGGLFHLGPKGVERFDESDGLTSGKIRSILVDPDGTVWVGTEGGGVDRIASGRIESLTTAKGLPNALVRAIYRDREGSVWLGTNGGGLVGLKRRKLVRYSARRGLSSEAVRVIIEASDGAIWLGTDGGGINVIRDDAITTLDERRGLPSNFVRSLLEASDGTMWVGTVGAGLVTIRDGVIRRFRGELPSDTILALEEGADGTVWVGTNRGLTSVRGGEVRTYGREDGLMDLNVRALAFDREGRLWAGTAAGLHVIHDGSIEEFPRPTQLERSIFCVRVDRDGSVWVGSDGGVSLIRDGRAFDFGPDQGMPDEAVFQILEDDLGSLWMSGNRGILRVERSALERIAKNDTGAVEVERFGRADGMYTDQCNGATQPAGWKARDGRLWFPTPYGAVVVDPADLRRNTLAPPVGIETVRIDGKPVSIEGVRADGRPVDPKSRRLTLPPGYHRLEIDYAAMSFISPEGVRFRHRLEGMLDDQWIDAGGRRTAFFTNIGPGAYRFHVIASNNDGVWNEQGATFEVRVEPFFWQRPAFIGLAVVAVLALIWAIIRIRTHGIEMRRRELERVVDERTAQLEEANRKLEHLSITDPLTGAANRRRFDEAFQIEWKRAIRSQEPVSILMIDVDRFKSYNDAFGHQRGDECLQRIAHVLMSGARRVGDLVARYGGEEYAVILTVTDLERACALAESLRLGVERLGIESADGGVMTVSIGVASVVPTTVDDRDALVASADHALYRAKRDGRNRVVSGTYGTGADGPASDS